MSLSKIFYLILLLKCAQTQNWENPAFLPKTDEDRVLCCDMPIEGHYRMKMEENMESGVMVAFLNYADETKPPTISKFTEPSPTGNNRLGASFQYSTEAGKWALVIEISQDYDNKEDGFRYNFDIQIGEVVNTLYLFIGNVDDESPIITVHQNPCEVDENYVGATNCVYTITDVDGIMNDVVNYKLSGSGDIEKFFEFRHDQINNEMKEWNVTLHTLQTLDYENISVYIFDFTVEDSGKNNDTARIVVRVNDLPDEPPIWRSIFSSKEILEKETMTFDVLAVDGDATINAEVNYKLETEVTEDEKLFSINENTGKITINAINRDELQREVFLFTLIAYEKDDETSQTEPQTVTIVVQDKNDNRPLITIDKTFIKIPESTVTTLDIDININDPDLGEHATYSVSLGDDEFNEAFQIVPNRGYQEWSFSISVRKPELLDYENEPWREIILQIKSQETLTEEGDTKIITVELLNWNDETPEFEKDEYIVSIPEDIPINKFIEKVHAIDADVGDTVIHKILGKAMEDAFSINEETGEIKTRVTDALDYEKQQVVIINVQAQDTLGDSDLHHTVVTQLTINVQDINDEPPRISVDVGSISVKENQPDSTLINENFDIIARDEDTEAQLNFYIDWTASSAVKNGQVVKQEDYEGCIKVATETIRIGEAKALLTIEEITPGNTPDYEKFDTLNIFLVAEDTDQTIEPKTDSVRIAIVILDINDNKPIFDENTISSEKNVRENSTDNPLIATITAKDEDGPEYNKITYSLSPADDKTPADWVTIDEESGSLFVIGDIDADLPIHNLKYIVVASDKNYSTEAEISINVIDINDNAPISSYDTVVYLPEDSTTGALVQTINAVDNDRDEVHNVPWYRFTQFVSNEVINFFSIDLSSGAVEVDYKGLETLDRDRGTTEFNIPFIVGDDYVQIGIGNQHQVLGSFTIKLLDVNDNAPIIQTKEFTTREEITKGTSIGIIEAIDIDEPNTDNTAIKFEIEEITKDGDQVPQDLFSHTPDSDPHSGKTTLITNYDLKGFHGTYHITIKTYDLGVPQKSETATIDVTVEKFNFAKPQFVFPNDGDTLYLTTDQDLYQKLVNLTGEDLPPFYADDLQGGKWNLLYTVSETSDDDIFYMNPNGSIRADLQMKKHPIYDNPYELTITADCTPCIGNAESIDSVTIKIRFINENSEPYFSKPETDIQFSENSTGVNKVQQLPKASYSGEEGEEWDQSEIYYFLTEDSSSCFELETKKSCFELDTKTAMLTLKYELDREEEDEHTLVVVTSRSPNGNSQPDEKSILTVHIEVLDVNDNPPNFDPKSYFGAVKQSDDLNKVIKSVQATDLDKHDSMTFGILPNSMQNIGEVIKDIENPFYVDEQNGDIKLNFSVKFNMEGYFTFKMTVVDEADHDDIADITIYVVSQSSSYTFTFENDEQTVKSKETDVAQILEESFGYISNIEKIERSTNDIGETLSEATDVVVHFIDNETNEPTDSSVIDQRMGNVEFFSSLNTKFREVLLFLKVSSKAPVEENMEESLRAWLIGVSVGLGTLCFALIIAFIVKTRSLTVRLNKLSTTEFGSQESGLNRIGVAAPNTNKHAIEGSNPVYNEEKKMPDVDTTSIGSGDSDLIGIEDNPNFQYDSDIFNGNFKPNGDVTNGHLNLNNTKY